MNNRGVIALSQIFILIIGIIAISYIVGSSLGFVSGVEITCDDRCSIRNLIKARCGTPNGCLNGETAIGETKDCDYCCCKEKIVKELLGGDEEDILEVSEGEGIPEIVNAPYGLNKKMKGGWGYLFGHIAQGAIWAVAVYGGIQTIGELSGGEESLVDSAATALSLGVFLGKTTIGAIQGIGGTGAAWLGIGATGWGIIIGAAVAIGTFLIFYKHETQEIIAFTGSPWDAPEGGEHCNECNNQGILLCSEYQCRSLGQACELLNRGTDEEKCAWVGRNDVEFPIIEPWEEALINDDYEYNPDEAISPLDRGVTIDYIGEGAGEDNCIPAFTPLSFGVESDEPAKCKFDISRKNNFEDMRFEFSGGLLLEEHSYALSLPGTGGDIEIENNGEYEIYVRCQDANGNSNTANFVFKFCVEQGPDTTPPLIVTTSIPTGMPIAYEQTSIDTEVYINEPVEGCRWSHLDQSYENMGEEMDCTSGNNLNDVNSKGLYTCDTTLDGLKDRQENKFYFRCKDISGNINEESYVYTLIGTQPLVIDWIKPETESTIKDSTERVKVTLEAKTSAGYKEGEASCYYSDTGETEDYILFYNTNSYQHSQDLWLDEGSYTYYIKCIDLGGNSDVESTNFEVESDGDEPIVVRAYYEEKYLKLITNEPARCVYDTKYESLPCDYSFDDGTPMTTIEDVNHYTDWNTQITFYIVCQDEYGTQPAYGECSKIIRPSDIY